MEPRRLLLAIRTEVQYFVEYFESIKPYLQFNYILLNNQNEIDNFNYNETDIYFFPRRMTQTLVNKKCKKIFINTEQLSHPEHYQACLYIINNGIHVLDYSPENLAIMNSPLMHYVPYQFNAKEVLKIKTFLKEPKTHDIAFCGYPSQRRLDILNQLKAKGYTVYNVEGWYDARDKEIAKCRILINIHFSDTYGIYETIRCDRWLFSGLPVVSEDSRGSGQLDVIKHIHFTSYGNLVSQVEETLKTPTDALLMNDVFTNRKEEIEKVNSLVSSMVTPVTPPTPPLIN